jgi:ParB-like nuclease domain
MSTLLHQRLLKPADAAEFLGLSTSNLAKRRMTGEGPRFVKMNGAVRYDLEGLQADINRFAARPLMRERSKRWPKTHRARKTRRRRPSPGYHRFAPKQSMARQIPAPSAHCKRRLRPPVPVRSVARFSSTQSQSTTVSAVKWGTDGLAASIADVGLLHPIVVDQDGNLLAGARRLAAFKILKRETIPFTVVRVPQ